jgi:tripartite-type tricarboxylate transporter receptor subunit TctC
MTIRRRRVVLALLAAAPLWAVTPAQAQNYPDRPIHIVVPYTPGGSADAVARSLAERMRKLLGQPVIVDNKPGANTVIGAQAVAQATPDGYTVLLGTGSTFVTNPFVYSKLAYNPERDFAPVAPVVISPLVIAVNPDLPAKNFQEFIRLARSQPGKMNYGSTGSGSIMHLGTLQLNGSAGLEMTHVPFKGSSPALTATMAGDVQVFMDSVGSALPLIKGGKLRAIAVTTPERLKSLPDVPTVAENGFANFDVTAWYGVMAPARTPPEIIARLNAVINEALADRELQERFAALGFTMPKRAEPAAFGAFVKSERDRWGPIVKNNKINLD